MSGLKYTQAATTDLDEIWLYVAQDSLTAADRLLERIGQAAARLRDFPEIGMARPDLAEGLRNLVVGSYLIFYRPRGPLVVVERVLHGHRDITSDLF